MYHNFVNVSIKIQTKYQFIIGLSPAFAGEFPLLAAQKNRHGRAAPVMKSIQFCSGYPIIPGKG